MVNQDVVEDSGHCTKLATVNKKHCHYCLFDRLPQTLKNSAVVQEYLAVELGLRKSFILVALDFLVEVGSHGLTRESGLVAVEALDVQTNNQSPTPSSVLKTKTNSNEGARRAPRTSIQFHSMSLNGQ